MHMLRSKMPSIYHEHCGKPGPKSSDYNPPPESRVFKSRSAPNSPSLERKPLFPRSPRMAHSPRLTRTLTLQLEKRHAEKTKDGKSSKSAKVGRSKSFGANAEQRNSLGKAWHPSCLRCEECGKRLNPGQHSEHRGIPYCNIPCYSLLFGPGGYGHGGTESHKHLGEEKLTQAERDAMRNEIFPKLKDYNMYFETRKALQMSCKEANGHLILEGVLRVYWGLKNPVVLASQSMLDWKRKRSITEQTPHPVNHKKQAILKELRELKENDMRPRTSSLERILARRRSITNKHINESSGDAHGEKKVCSPVNYYLKKASPPKTMFTPPCGTSTNLRLTSKTKIREVVKLLFSKFQITSNPKRFNLYVVYENGSTRVLKDTESPLHSRLLLGPSEYAAKIYIMEAKDENNITQEVAQYIHFADPVLEAFLKKFEEEEENDIQTIKQWYGLYREKLQERLSTISTEV